MRKNEYAMRYDLATYGDDTLLTMGIYIIIMSK